MTTTSGFEESWQTGSTQCYQTASDQSLSEAVVLAVATTAEQKPTAASDIEGRDVLDPLYETIDSDALDTLFHSLEDTGKPTGHVEFTYCGYDVTVESTGLVTVTET